MAVREEEPAVYEAIGKLGAEAILTFKTDGWDDEDVNWVTPEQLLVAATKLREAVHAGSREMQVILDTYDEQDGLAVVEANQIPTTTRQWLKISSKSLTTS